MAAPSQVIALRDSTNVTGDGRVTGQLAVAKWIFFKDFGGTPHTAPTLAEIGNGQYLVSGYDVETNGESSGQIDWGPFGGTNAVQTITPPGSSTFNITILGQTLTGVAFNVPVATLQGLVTGLSSVGTNLAGATNCAVTGTAGTTYVLTFQNQLGNQPITAVTTTAGSVAQTTPGVTNYQVGSDRFIDVVITKDSNRIQGSLGASGILLSRVLDSPRDVSAIADASLTLNDALWGALCAATGKQSVSGTTYQVKTPSDGTQIRSFTLNSSTTPTSRS